MYPSPAPVPVPDIHKMWIPAMRHYIYTGGPARELSLSTTAVRSTPVAIDIETAGLEDLSFYVKCFTASFVGDDGETHALLLDPRREDDAQAIARIVEESMLLILHNAPFDLPPLHHLGCFPLECVDKVHDTAVLSRMAFPDRLVDHSLAAMVAHPDVGATEIPPETMATAFAARGFATQREGWEGMDIDSLSYRLGAMADTTATLRIAAPLHELCVNFTMSNPIESPHGCTTREHAERLINREMVTNRVMMRRNMQGLGVDTNYLDSYLSSHVAEQDKNTAILDAAGIRPGNGADLVTALSAAGGLPDNWPTTKTGKLKADKAALGELPDHPLVTAHLQVKELAKVTDYLTKIKRTASITGRTHPQTQILGAATTGRMSYSAPPLQQFSADARPIIVPDEGTDWVSIDWSSIEPVLMANCARDHAFLQGFDDHGADLYLPIVERAGVDRKTAKVILLASMYGQGLSSLAARLKVDVEQARELKARVFGEMRATEQFMLNIKAAGGRTGHAMSPAGRHLLVPRGPDRQLKDYVAVNQFCQGGAYDVLSECVNEVYRRGLSDAVHIIMHDELIVSADVAEEVQSIMETPPEWLNAWAGKQVVLRTDANPLHGHWEYV